MEFINSGQWWWLLIPLGTGICALLGSWLGSFLGKTTEHDQWLRNQRMQTYTEFLEACTVMRNRSSGILNHTDEKFHESHALLGSGSAQFVASGKVREEIERFLSVYLPYVHGLTMIEPGPNASPTPDDVKREREFEKASEALRSAFRRELKM
jgi:hypothetical protein